MKISRRIGVLAMAGVMPALAHHSFAAYDLAKTESAQATIKEFYWGAPHSSAVFTLKKPDGTTQDIALQGAAPGAMSRAGFKPKDMKRGEKVEIVWHPLRNGSLGGSLSSIKFSDGRVFKDSEFAVAPGGAGGPPGGAGGPPGAGVPPPEAGAP